jgi:hypothetical protein
MRGKELREIEDLVEETEEDKVSQKMVLLLTSLKEKVLPEEVVETTAEEEVVVVIESPELKVISHQVKSRPKVELLIDQTPVEATEEDATMELNTAMKIKSVFTMMLKQEVSQDSKENQEEMVRESQESQENQE